MIKIIRKLYNWVLHWAHTKYSSLALFLLAFSGSSFFPIPPDVLLIALAISINKKAFKFAIICSLGSIMGGIFGYYIGYELWYVNNNFSGFAHLFFDYIPGFTETLFYRVMGLYNKYSFLIVFSAGFSPIPYKVFTITAGVTKINFFNFLMASTVSRSLRFFIVAGLIYKYGKPIKSYIDKYFDKLSLLLVILLILGFVVIKYIF
ncbi:MAG TPA: YqaA family protein [Candidatus Mcinerneyibacterium sp.]|nr:YqaA family protein [Candidatus Mcinerneyibacterium sp.]